MQSIFFRLEEVYKRGNILFVLESRATGIQKDDDRKAAMVGFRTANQASIERVSPAVVKAKAVRRRQQRQC
jgi:hypothetical protein